MIPPAPLLVFGWGNPARGDDALGPLLVEQLVAHANAASPPIPVEGLTDFQLQVEHALDLVGRKRILFVDAAVALETPFEARAIQPARAHSFTTHALKPEALLQVFVDLERTEPPPATLLAIRATDFTLGTAPSPAALADLSEALEWAVGWLVGC